MSSPTKSRGGFGSPVRVLQWLIQNSIFVSIAFLALVKHVVWADNLLSFFTPLFCVIGLVYTTEDARKTAAKKGRAVPAWLSVFSDLTIIVIAACAGRYWIAAGWVWISVSESILHRDSDEKGEQP